MDAIEVMQPEGSSMLPSPPPTSQDTHTMDKSDDTPGSGGNRAPSDTASTAATTTLTTSRSRKFPSDMKTIACTWPGCTKSFNRPARLAAHLRAHKDERPFKCTYPGCPKAYREEKHLRGHVQGAHTGERKYACSHSGCGRSFLTGTRLRRHAAVHAGAERFRCRGYEGCSQTFRKHQTLARHVRSEHLGLKPYGCSASGCPEAFDTMAALRRHVEREHKEPHFWCEACARDGPEEGGQGGQDGEDDDDGEDDMGEDDDADADVNVEPLRRRRVGFATQALLEAHVRLEHIDCIFCEVRCRSQADLERHVEMYHSGATVEDRKTVVCAWDGCPKRFTRVSNLNAHVRTAHQGLRFVCGAFDLAGTPADLAAWDATHACGRGFISRLKLEEHVRHVHLKLARPPKPTQPPPPPATVAALALALAPDGPPAHVDLLSGVAHEARLAASCTHPGCGARFVRYHELTLHVQQHHPAPEPTALGLSGPDAPAEWAFDEADMARFLSTALQAELASLDPLLS